MPSVQRVHEALKDKGVVMLAISIDGTGMKAVAPYVTRHGYTMPTAIDPEMQVARKFGVRGVPTTFIINRQGEVVAGGFGPIDFDHPDFRQYIESLVAQP
jgi:peroxiredoxin